jgi:7-cyano-7-deazaguanine synthase
MNSLLNENRKNAICIAAPFVSLSKVEEIQAVLDLDGNVDLLKNTLTCYNPSQPDGHGHYGGDSCGVCPSCAERLAAFAKLGIVDPVKYQEKK